MIRGAWRHDLGVLRWLESHGHYEMLEALERRIEERGNIGLRVWA